MLVTDFNQVPARPLLPYHSSQAPMRYGTDQLLLNGGGNHQRISNTEGEPQFMRETLMADRHCEMVGVSIEAPLREVAQTREIVKGSDPPLFWWRR